MRVPAPPLHQLQATPKGFPIIRDLRCYSPFPDCLDAGAGAVGAIISSASRRTAWEDEMGIETVKPDVFDDFRLEALLEIRRHARR